MKHYRLLGILLLLENNPVMTAKAIADHFEVSVRTIYRDLDVLSEAGYSIVTESGKGGGVALQYNKRLRLSAMDKSELLKVVERFAIFDKDDQLSENLALKIRGQLPEEARIVFDRLRAASLVDKSNWYGISDDKAHFLSLVQESIINEFKIKMDYKSSTGYTADRMIWPLGIVKKAGQDYLVGYCELRSEIRTFKMDRIIVLKQTEVRFKSPADFDLKKYWDHATPSYLERQVFNRNFKEDNKGGYLVTLKCPEKHLVYFSGFKCISADDEGRFTFDMVSESVALAQIMTHVDEIHVCSPESLRAVIKRKCQFILENY